MPSQRPTSALPHKDRSSRPSSQGETSALTPRTQRSSAGAADEDDFYDDGEVDVSHAVPPAGTFSPTPPRSPLRSNSSIRERGSAPSQPTMDYTTGRRNMHIPSSTVGSHSFGARPSTASVALDQRRHAAQAMANAESQRLVYQPKLRPQSARVQAAAFRCYGPSSAKGIEKPPPPTPPMPFVNASTSIIGSVKAHRPTSAILGGGYHLPTRRPHTAHERSTRTQPHSLHASFEGYPDGPPMTGTQMVDAPALQRPWSAGPTMMSSPRAGGSMYRTSSFYNADGQEQRLGHTLPTDPRAHRFWDQLTKRADFTAPTADASAESRNSLAPSPFSSIKGRIPRPHSAQLLRAPERFSSIPVSKQQQLMADCQPKKVSGFSPPVAELAVPPASNIWWQGHTRLGRTAINTIDAKVKMSQAAISAPASENQRARAAKGAQLSPLKPYQPPPHSYPTADADITAKGAAPDQGVHHHQGGEYWVKEEEAQQDHHQQQEEEQQSQDHAGVLREDERHVEHTVFQQPYSVEQQHEDLPQASEEGGGGVLWPQAGEGSGEACINAESQQVAAGS